MPGGRMPLVIVESPNKIQKIKKCLPDDYEVISSYGHIMDLDKKDMGIKMPDYEPVYKVYDNKKDVVKKIKDCAAEHDTIYVATDLDREGEAIAYNILEILPKKNKKIIRVVFAELNKATITDQIKNPIGWRPNVYSAQVARRVTDRFVGFKVSPLMWSKGLRNTSAGRVQSPALKYIVDREKEIKSFKKEEYWEVKAMMKDFSSDLFEINDKKIDLTAKEIVDEILKDMPKTLKVTEYLNKKTSRSPEPPFKTSTLQKDAGTRFKWTGKKTMDIAQNLFSQGLITYHRTDSIRIEPAKVDSIREKIASEYGDNYIPEKPIIYEADDGAQDAHEAIRPTFEAEPNSLTADDRKLLKLITDRFTASQMSDAQFDKVSVKMSCNRKDKYTFRTSGSIQTFDGFLKVYGSTQDNVLLPLMKKGQDFSVGEYKPSQHFTKPPPRWTDPAIVDRIEKDKVGRPSTFATIVETLIDHKYVVREKSSLIPTEIGIMVCDYLSSAFEKLTNPSFTADMEEDLNKIAKGTKGYVESVDGFYQQLLIDIDTAKRDKDRVTFKTEIKCKKCENAFMVKKIGPSGVFLGCENYPTCGHVMNMGDDGEYVDSTVETGHSCPVCSSIVVKRKGPRGFFFGCSSYPVCTWAGSISEDGEISTKQAKESTDKKCPECNEHNLSIRNGKFGKFFGCDGYPKCKFIGKIGSDGELVIKSDKPKAKSLNESCPKCKSNLVEREAKGSKFIGCSSYPKCKYTRKIK
jgi:DNA topoisomerase I